ncbi:MAG: hypothetical protein ABF535_11035 [Acetobacter sp.]
MPEGCASALYHVGLTLRVDRSLMSGSTGLQCHYPALQGRTDKGLRGRLVGYRGPVRQALCAELAA